jgi:[ribosomal protein S5]-alanine N-acetyltransferase
MSELLDLNTLKTLEIISSKDDLVLCALKESVVSKKYLSWMRDYEVVKFTEQRHSIQNIHTIREFVVKKYKSECDLLMGIYSNEKHIGNVKLGDIDVNNLTATVSYIIGNKSYWNKGIGTKVIGMVLEIAFQKLRIEKVLAGVYVDNLGSIKVLENCGFIKDAALTKYLMLDGFRQEILQYKKLKPVVTGG